MGPIIVIGVGIIAVLWFLGWLTPRRLQLIGAATSLLVGLRVLAMGQPLVAAGLLLFAGWLAFGGVKPGAGGMPLDDARRVLGLGDAASEAEIQAAHRRLIAEAHPDKGGSDELSSRINAARDVLVKHLRSSGR